eukprot:scaffold226829_cov27-Tisochrysis_lutea.AAC.1
MLIRSLSFISTSTFDAYVVLQRVAYKGPSIKAVQVALPSSSQVALPAHVQVVHVDGHHDWHNIYIRSQI